MSGNGFEGNGFEGNGSDGDRFLGLVEHLGAALVRDTDFERSLRSVSHQAALLTGMDSVALLLGDGKGDVRYLAAEDDRLRQLEVLQVELQEGPCVDTLWTHEPVAVEDLSTDPRYPRFAREAIKLGPRSVYSVPMHLDGRTVGAFNLFSDRARRLDAEHRRMCASLADLTTALLVNAEERDRSDLLTRQLQEALDSRVIIEQAKGFVAAQCGVDMQDAFKILRGFSRHHQRKLREVAQAVVAGDLPVNVLNANC